MGRGDLESEREMPAPVHTLLWKEMAGGERVDSLVFSGRLLRPEGQQGPHHRSILGYDIQGLLLN